MGFEHGLEHGRQCLPPPLRALGAEEDDVSMGGELTTALAPSTAPFHFRHTHTSFRNPSPGSVTSSNSSTSASPDTDEPAPASSASSVDSDAYVQPELLLNPRRTSGNGFTPSFQRSDKGHKNFIEGLLAVTTSFVEAIWPLSRETPRSSTDFNGAGVLPLRTFIQETCRRSRTSYSTLQIALYYLVLLKEVLPDLDFAQEQPREIVNTAPRDPHILLGQPNRPSECRVMQCGRRMFMSALMLAAKYLQDRNFSVKAWAKISGLSCSEINTNEKAYLQSIEYRLHLKKEYFDNWSQIVLALCNAEKTKLSLDYTKIIWRLTPEIIRVPEYTIHFLKELEGRRYQATGLSSACSQASWMRHYLTNDYHGLQITKTSSIALMTSSSTCYDLQSLTANTYSCPPPHQGNMSLSESFRKQIVPPFQLESARSTKSSSSSPASTLDSIFSSDSAEVVSRTRSSSISSTSSAGSISDVRVNTKATTLPVLRSAFENATNTFQAENAEKGHRISVTNQPDHLNVTSKRPEVVVGCTKRKASSAIVSSENAAARLAIRSKGSGQHSDILAAEDQNLSIKKAQRRRGSTKPVKAGHTSESVKARRHMQRDTARMAKSGHGLPDALPEEKEADWSPSEATIIVHEEPESQAIHITAGCRKSMPALDNPNKRVAVSAADLATLMLRPDVERGLGIIG